MESLRRRTTHQHHATYATAKRLLMYDAPPQLPLPTLTEDEQRSEPLQSAAASAVQILTGSESVEADGVSRLWGALKKMVADTARASGVTAPRVRLLGVAMTNTAPFFVQIIVAIVAPHNLPLATLFSGATYMLIVAPLTNATFTRELAARGVATSAVRLLISHLTAGALNACGVALAADFSIVGVARMALKNTLDINLTNGTVVALEKVEGIRARIAVPREHMATLERVRAKAEADAWRSSVQDRLLRGEPLDDLLVTQPRAASRLQRLCDPFGVWEKYGLHAPPSQRSPLTLIAASASAATAAGLLTRTVLGEYVNGLPLTITAPLRKVSETLLTMLVFPTVMTWEFRLKKKLMQRLQPLSRQQRQQQSTLRGHYMYGAFYRFFLSVFVNELSVLGSFGAAKWSVGSLLKASTDPSHFKRTVESAASAVFSAKPLSVDVLQKLRSIQLTAARADAVYESMQTLLKRMQTTILNAPSAAARSAEESLTNLRVVGVNVKQLLTDFSVSNVLRPLQRDNPLYTRLLASQLCTAIDVIAVGASTFSALRAEILASAASPQLAELSAYESMMNMSRFRLFSNLFSTDLIQLHHAAVKEAQRLSLHAELEGVDAPPLTAADAQSMLQWSARMRETLSAADRGGAAVHELLRSADDATFAAAANAWKSTRGDADAKRAALLRSLGADGVGDKLTRAAAERVATRHLRAAAQTTQPLDHEKSRVTTAKGPHKVVPPKLRLKVTQIMKAIDKAQGNIDKTAALHGLLASMPNNDETVDAAWEASYAALIGGDDTQQQTQQQTPLTAPRPTSTKHAKADKTVSGDHLMRTYRDVKYMYKNGEVVFAFYDSDKQRTDIGVLEGGAVRWHSAKEKIDKIKTSSKEAVTAEARAASEAIEDAFVTDAFEQSVRRTVPIQHDTAIDASHPAYTLSTPSRDAAILRTAALRQLLGASTIDTHEQSQRLSTALRNGRLSTNFMERQRTLELQKDADAAAAVSAYAIQPSQATFNAALKATQHDSALHAILTDMDTLQRHEHLLTREPHTRVWWVKGATEQQIDTLRRAYNNIVDNANMEFNTGLFSAWAFSAKTPHPPALSMWRNAVGDKRAQQPHNPWLRAGFFPVDDATATKLTSQQHAALALTNADVDDVDRATRVLVRLFGDSVPSCDHADAVAYARFKHADGGVDTTASYDALMARGDEASVAAAHAMLKRAMQREGLDTHDVNKLFDDNTGPLRRQLRPNEAFEREAAQYVGAAAAADGMTNLLQRYTAEGHINLRTLRMAVRQHVQGKLEAGVHLDRAYAKLLFDTALSQEEAQRLLLMLAEVEDSAQQTQQDGIEYATPKSYAAQLTALRGLLNSIDPLPLLKKPSPTLPDKKAAFEIRSPTRSGTSFRPSYVQKDLNIDALLQRVPEDVRSTLRNDIRAHNINAKLYEIARSAKTVARSQLLTAAADRNVVQQLKNAGVSVAGWAPALLKHSGTILAVSQRHTSGEAAFELGLSASWAVANMYLTPFTVALARTTMLPILNTAIVNSGPGRQSELANFHALFEAIGPFLKREATVTADSLQRMVNAADLERVQLDAATASTLAAELFKQMEHAEHSYGAKFGFAGYAGGALVGVKVKGDGTVHRATIDVFRRAASPQNVESLKTLHRYTEAALRSTRYDNYLQPRVAKAVLNAFALDVFTSVAKHHIPHLGYVLRKASFATRLKEELRNEFVGEGEMVERLTDKIQSTMKDKLQRTLPRLDKAVREGADSLRAYFDTGIF